MTESDAGTPTQSSLSPLPARASRGLRSGQLALLIGSGLLTLGATQAQPLLVHGPFVESVQARLGLSGMALGHAVAGVTGLAALVLVLTALRCVRQVSGIFRAFDRNLTALRLSEARMAGILDTALDCIISIDQQGKIIEFNPAAERAFGTTRAQVLGRELAEVIIPAELRAAHRQGLARYLATGQSRVLNHRIEVVALRPDGTSFPAELAVSPSCVEGQTTFTAYLRDLTEHKDTEETLRRQALVFANISDGVILTSLDGKIIDCNPAAESMFGYSKPELLGQSPSVLHRPEQSGVLTTQLIECLRREGRWADSIQFRRKDGTEGLCSTVLVPLCDEQGKRLATLRVNHDITEQHQAEQRQAAQHAVARVFAEAGGVPEAIAGVLQALCQNLNWPVGLFWELDRSSHVLRCREVWHAPHLPLGELRAACLAAAAGPGVGLAGRVWCGGEIAWAGNLEREDACPYAPQAVRVGLQGGLAIPVPLGEDIFGVLTLYSWQNGPPSEDLVRMLSAVGTQFGLFVERRRTDEALKMQAAVLENMAEGVLVADEDARICFTNPAFDAIFGYERGQLAGQHVGVLNQLPQDENDLLVASILKELKTRGTWSGEIRNRKQDGTPLFTSARISALTMGGKTYSVCVQEDITERKRAEEELRRAKRAAEEANRLKGEFLANMSHEIRTPLNGIIGMTGLALDTELTREQSEYLNMVRGSAESLLEVINDILDFSKIEAGKLDLDPIDFPLRNTVAETLKPLGLRAHKKSLELAYHVSPAVPDALVGDPGRLRQILVNLVGNAIKFTEQGEVVVQADLEVTEPTAVTLHFTVRDTGVGIPPEKQQLIFDAFAQADGSTTRKYGGTGLGLGISARLVQMMGGRIWVESEPGRGSTFHFTARFPLQEDPLTRSLPRNLVRLWDMPVLVVDDNATNRHILEKMLASFRIQPTTARDGPAALDLLEQARAAGNPFGLILIDAAMPSMDGFALVERIRQHPALICPVVMMLTADDLASDLARCEALGIGSYVMKPIKQSELLEALLTALRLSLGGTNRRPAVTVERPRAEPAKLRILLAEDHPVNQRLAARLLEKRGHTVVVVNNGKEALECLEHQQFDLVLMDVQMPEMGGFEAVSHIRAREASGLSSCVRGGRLPIIALTAHAMRGDRERCLEAGMDHYAAKPIQPEALWQAIRDVLTAKPDPVAVAV